MHIAVRSIGKPSHILTLELESRVKVPVFEFSSVVLMQGSAEYNQLVTDDLRGAQGHDPNAIRRNLPTICYNCHGLTLATRRGWLNDVSVVLMQESNSYVELPEGERTIQGDLIVYFDQNKSITHTGLVVEDVPHTVLELTSGGFAVRVQSKWGFLGEYIHDHNKCPYGTNVKFLRYVRSHF